MKKSLITFGLLISVALGAVKYFAADETPPSGLYNVQNTFYQTSDKQLWLNKGPQYGWNRVARYSDLLIAGSGSANVRTNAQQDSTTAANYYNKTQSNARYQPVGIYVNTFNGRSGTVVPLANDYAFNMLSGIPTTIGGYGITDAYTKTQSDANYYPLSSNPSNYLNPSAAAMLYQPLENQRLSTTNAPTFAGLTSTGAGQFTGQYGLKTSSSVGSYLDSYATTANQHVYYGVDGSGNANIQTTGLPITFRPNGVEIARFTTTGFTYSPGTAGAMQKLNASKQLSDAVAGVDFLAAPNNFRNNAATFTLPLTNLTNYGTFFGSAATWTLGTVAAGSNVTYYIKNAGSGALTINSAAGGNDIYYTSAVATISIAAGNAIIIHNDGVNWQVE